MKITEKLTEYALVGCLFWFGQGLLLILFAIQHGYSGSALGNEQAIKALGEFYGAIPALLQPLAAGLITVFSLVFVFSSGFLIHILGNFFVLSEVYLFTRELKENDAWLNELSSKHSLYLQGSYLRLRDYDWEAGRDLRDAAKTFRPWQAQAWKNMWIDYRMFFDQFRLLEPFDRMQSFLLSFSLSLSGAEKFEYFADTVKQWRLARVLAATFFLLSIEYCLFALRRPSAASEIPTLVTLITALILMLASVSLTLRSYKRFCSLLFSLTYVAMHEQEKG